MDAKVLFIVKTWPRRRYQQRAYVEMTDSEGRFNLKGAVPLGHMYAVLVAAFKEGWAFQSVYSLAEEGEPFKPVSFQLRRSRSLRLRILDEAGTPVNEAMVSPSMRMAGDGPEHLIYKDSSDAVRKLTGEDGLVTLDCFMSGDQARVRVVPPGVKGFVEEFLVPEEGDEIIDIQVKP